MAAEFVVARHRGEAVAIVVVGVVAELLEAVGADVMVGEDKTFRGDERPRAPRIEADARLLEMEEPFRRRLEAVILLEPLERRLVEQPHPLVAPGKP